MADHIEAYRRWAAADDKRRERTRERGRREGVESDLTRADIAPMLHTSKGLDLVYWLGFARGIRERDKTKEG